MLRKRIEKLERLRPLGTGDLLHRWEWQAMAALTSEEQALVPALFATESCSKKPHSDEEIAAMTCYEKALAESIREVSDAELDRMIMILGPATEPAEAML